MKTNDQLKAGRRAPYTHLGEWILLADISAGAKVLYWALKAHVNNSREDDLVWPSQQRLAAILVMSQPSVNRFLKELIKLGAIERQRPARPGGHCTYLVHETPPDGYAGLLTLPSARTAPFVRPVAPLAPVSPEQTRPATPTNTNAPTASGPEQSPEHEQSPEFDGSAVVILRGAGVAPSQTLRKRVAERLTEGWTVDEVRSCLAGCAVGARDPGRVAASRLRQLGSPPSRMSATVSVRPASAQRARCEVRGHESQRPGSDCMFCNVDQMAPGRKLQLTDRPSP